MSDVRRGNSGGENEYPATVANPAIAEMAERAGELGRRSPGVPHRASRRDIKSAFRRVPIRPGACAI